jgi:hypothetical protein
MVFEQGGIFIMPHLRGLVASISIVTPKGPLYLMALHDKENGLKTYSNPEPHEIFLYTNLPELTYRFSPT